MKLYKWKMVVKMQYKPCLHLIKSFLEAKFPLPLDKKTKYKIWTWIAKVIQRINLLGTSEELIYILVLKSEVAHLLHPIITTFIESLAAEFHFSSFLTLLAPKVEFYRFYPPFRFRYLRGVVVTRMTCDQRSAVMLSSVSTWMGNRPVHWVKLAIYSNAHTSTEHD